MLGFGRRSGFTGDGGEYQSQVCCLSRAEQHFRRMCRGPSKSVQKRSNDGDENVLDEYGNQLGAWAHEVVPVSLLNESIDAGWVLDRNERSAGTVRYAGMHDHCPCSLSVADDAKVSICYKEWRVHRLVHERANLMTPSVRTVGVRHRTPFGHACRGPPGNDAESSAFGALAQRRAKLAPSWAGGAPPSQVGGLSYMAPTSSRPYVRSGSA